MVENLAYLFDPSNTEPPCDPPQNAAQRRMPQHNRRTTAAQPPHSRRTAAATEHQPHLCGNHAVCGV